MGRSLALQRGSAYGLVRALGRELETHPLRTKAAIAGALASSSEIIAYYAAGNGTDPARMRARAAKLGVYGVAVSGPLVHYLVRLLQVAFRGRTSAGARALQNVLANVAAAPIANAVLLAAMSVISGARRADQVAATVRYALPPAMRLTWLALPLVFGFAQRCLPPEAWAPFLQAVAFVVGTYHSALYKQQRQAARGSGKD
ncbi:uncharacterized protein V1510DRAFT_420079, partial [Dipodascopsis tothii]|uniref:uncharacterized protein n=1 Tax=Dipodascopsis tothii TaxID=44089 RepID=UPI0034CF26BD